MTVLVTGAAGYLGRHIVRQLAAMEIPVTAQIRTPKSRSPRSCDSVAVADLCDGDAIRRVFATHHPHTVIHCAAHIPRIISDAEAKISFRDNVTATETLLDACREYDVRRVVYASTISVYARALDGGTAAVETDPLAPQGFYGEHKLAGETLCRKWSLETGDRSGVILRYAGIHGGGRQSGVIYAFLTAALAGKPVSVGSPGSRFSFVNVSDAALAARLAISRPPEPGVSTLNIAGAEIVSLKDLALGIIAITTSNSEIIYGDAPPRGSAMSIDAAKAALGFNPSPLHSWLTVERDLIIQMCDGNI